MDDKWQVQHALAALAGEQHGVITGRQLAALGWSRSRVSDEARRARLHRVHQGVYAVGHARLTELGRCCAAVLAGGEEALLSHGSAGWLWGLAGSAGQEIHVTVPRWRRPVPGITFHAVADLHPADRSHHEAIAVTSPSLTLLGIAASRPLLLISALGRASRLGLLDLIAVDELLHRSRGRRGVARLRASLDDFREPAMTRSGVERRFLRLVRRAGLPKPSTNLFVEGYEIDAYWPTARFGVELDSYLHHGDARSFERDRRRQEDLKLRGIEIVRFTAARLESDPVAAMDRLRALLEQRVAQVRHLR